MSDLNDINPNISVDCVIFGFDGESLKALLIEEKDIGQGVLKQRLPGDLIHQGESLDDAADRVLWELASLRDVHLKQFHTFGNPQRVNARDFAENIIVGFARLAGKSIGIVANQPM